MVKMSGISVRERIHWLIVGITGRFSDLNPSTLSLDGFLQDMLRIEKSLERSKFTDEVDSDHLSNFKIYVQSLCKVIKLYLLEDYIEALVSVNNLIINQDMSLNGVKDYFICRWRSFPYRIKSLILGSVGLYEEAVHVTDSFINIQEKHNSSADFNENEFSILQDTYHLKVTLLKKMSKYEEAIHIIDDLILKIGNNIEHYHEDNKKSYIFVRILEILSDEYERKAFLLQEIGKHEEAIQAIDNLIVIISNNNEHYHEDNKKSYIYKSILEILRHGYQRKAFLLQKIGKHEEAIQVINTFIDLLVLETGENSSTVEECITRITISGKANLLAKIGRYEESIKVIDNLIAIKVKNGSSESIKEYIADELLNMSATFKETGKYDEELTLIEKVLNLVPPPYTMDRAYLRKTQILFYLNRHQEALENIDKVILSTHFSEINNEPFLFLKGQILHALHRYSDALALYDRIGLDQKADYWWHKGEAFRELVRYHEAEICYQKALAISPNYKNALDSLNKINQKYSPIIKVEHQDEKTPSLGDNKQTPFGEFEETEKQRVPTFNSETQQLHEAAKKGNITSLSEALTNPEVDITAQDTQGNTLLHDVVKESQKSIEVISELGKQAHINQLDIPNHDGLFPIHLAACAGKIEVLESLYLQGISLEKQDLNGKTPLHWATSKNQINTVKYLLRRGVNQHIKDNHGKTARDWAEEEAEEIIAMLEQPQLIPPKLSIIRNLVLQGGGPAGAAYLGAYLQLEAVYAQAQSWSEKTKVKLVGFQGVNFAELKRVGGASAGSITALLIALGYNYEQLKDVINKEFSELSDGGILTDIIFNIKKPLFSWIVLPFNIALMSIGLVLANSVFSNLKLRDRFLSLPIALMAVYLSFYFETFQSLGLLNPEAFGICEGEALRLWLDELIYKKTGIREASFAELHEKQFSLENKPIKEMYFVGTNVANKSSIVFSYETTPNVIISDAVRLSSSIPFFFKPHRIYVKSNGLRELLEGSDLYVDGGVNENYPIWLFDQAQYCDDWLDLSDFLSETQIRAIKQSYVFNRQTLGLRLVDSWQKANYESESSKGRTIKIETIKEYLIELFNLIYDRQEQVHLANQDSGRTIYIDRQGVAATDFDLTDDKKKALEGAGMKAVNDYNVRAYREDPTEESIISARTLKTLLNHCSDFKLRYDQHGIAMMGGHYCAQTMSATDILTLYQDVHSKEEMRFLKKIGLDINAKDKNGLTPLYWGVKNGDTDIVLKLLENNADVFMTYEGNSLLDVAVMHEKSKTREILVLQLLSYGLYQCQNKKAVQTVCNNSNQYKTDLSLQQACNHKIGTVQDRPKQVFQSHKPTEQSELNQLKTSSAAHLVNPISWLISLSPSFGWHIGSYFALSSSQPINATLEYDYHVTHKRNDNTWPSIGEISIPTNEKIENTLPFDSGYWDKDPYFLPETGDPIFIYRVFQAEVEVGTAHFYKHPLLCRSSEGNRHNLVQLTGVLAQIQKQIDLSTATFEDVCEALPPTFLEQLSTSMWRGAQHGLLRGATNALEYAMQKINVSAVKTSIIKYTAYYSGVFTGQFFQHYQSNAEDQLTEVTQTMYQAAIETGQVALIQIALQQVSQMNRHLGFIAKQYGWECTGKVFDFVSRNINYGIYGYDAYHQGIIKTTASVVTGITTEKTLESVGKKAVDCFLNGHKQALMPKYSKLTRSSSPQIVERTIELDSSERIERSKTIPLFN